MISPDLSLAWDSLDEKLVQEAIHHKYPNLIREVKLGINYVDFASPNHTLIELKRSSSCKGNKFLTRPSHAIGQLLGYKVEYEFQYNLWFSSKPVIMLYGSHLGKWQDEQVTRLRQAYGISLWCLVSLKNADVIDLDNGNTINLGEV